jgi:ribosomal protein S12 methylthiotransferase
MEQQISRKVKARRRHEAMMMQQAISLAKNRAFVDTTVDVLIEGVGELATNAHHSKNAGRDPELNCGNCVSIGRSYRDAPEVDGVVIVENELPVGRLVRVKITQATEYDVMGTPV